MKKSVVIIPVTLAVLVVVYLIYDLVKPSLTSPCESIFQQTSLNLKSNLAIIKSKGEVFIGRQKIQDLTEQAQLAALSLKTCCIMSEGGVLDAEEFLRCKNGAAQYHKQLAAVTHYINEAQQAKQQGQQKALDDNVRRLNAAIQSFQKTSLQMQNYLSQQQKKQLTDAPVTQTDSTKEKKMDSESTPQTSSGRINLIAAENGGRVLIGTSENWSYAIDGKESAFNFPSRIPEATFAFKDSRPGTFNTFAVLVLETQEYNLAEFELLSGNESPTGVFRSIGKFKAYNAKMFNTPYQKFEFPAVTAKYLRIRLLSNHAGPLWAGSVLEAREFQLWGTLK